MDGPTAFDDFVRRTNLGKRHIPGSLHPVVEAEFDRYRHRVRLFINSARTSLPTLSHVYADFVQNPVFNAIAAPADAKHPDDLHLIIIFAGMPVVTTAVVRRMLADRQLFRHASDADSEECELPKYAKITPNAAELFRTITAVTPKDEGRLIYCFHLQNTVFDFLAAHELTHIAHGHVRYLNLERGQPFLGEANWMEGTADGNLESQTMEMDADFNAAKLMMQNIDRLWKEHATLPEPLNEYYADRVRAVYDVAAAINIMCRIFGDMTFTGVDLDRSRHPPMAWRQMWIMNTLGNYLEHLWGEGMIQSGTEAIQKALHDVEMAFSVITGTIPSVTGLEEAWGPIGRAYGKKLSDCWNNALKSKLARHAYVNEMPHYGFDFPPNGIIADAL